VTVRIGGICKGSGMIAPDMATMLAFVVTDAAISPAALQNLCSLYTRNTFNAVTVDGDRSTNDTLLLFATGKSGAPKISRAGDRRLGRLPREAGGPCCSTLAHQLVRDGEGATKFIRINVTGAETHASARKIARTIAESPLVKTAFRRRGRQLGPHRHGGRPSRRAGRPRLHEREVRRPLGRPRRLVSSTYDEAKMSAYMKRQELEVTVDGRRRQGRGDALDLRPHQALRRD
jgi:glutamate N-acetyltransferase/amino-acid N-acetyltransferase